MWWIDGDGHHCMQGSKIGREELAEVVGKGSRWISWIEGSEDTSGGERLRPCSRHTVAVKPEAALHIAWRVGGGLG